MVYELRIYECIPGRLEAFLDLIQQSLGIFQKHGIRAVGYWTERYGSPYRVTCMIQWENEAERIQKLEGGLAQDPTWLALRDQLNLPESGGGMLSSVENRLLVPTVFSAMQ